MAAKLGEANVDRMLRGMSFSQFVEWQEYSTLEPFDETRADYRSAQIVTALWNIARDPKKHPMPFAIKDFLLPFGQQEAAPKKTAADIEMIFNVLAMVQGADS